jgi:hypothetical protein
MSSPAFRPFVPAAPFALRLAVANPWGLGR